MYIINLKVQSLNPYNAPHCISLYWKINQEISISFIICMIHVSFVILIFEAFSRPFSCSDTHNN